MLKSTNKYEKGLILSFDLKTETSVLPTNVGDTT